MLSGIAAARSTGKKSPVNAIVQGLIDADTAAHPERTAEEQAKANADIYLNWLKDQKRANMNAFDRNVQEEVDASDAKHKADDPPETPEEASERHREIYSKWAQAKKPPSDAIQKLLMNPQWLISPEGQKYIAKQDPDT